MVGIFDACTDDLGELAEEMGEGGGELVTTDEPAVDAEPLFDTIVMEDGESYGRLADPASTNQSEWSEAFSQTDKPLDQLVSSKEVPR